MVVVLLSNATTECEDKLLGTSNKSLNFEGKLQTIQLANFIKKQEEEIDLILSSSINRARQTATILSEEINNSYIENDLIIERDFKDLTLNTLKEFPPKFFIKDKFNYLIDINGIEPITDFEKRIREFIQFLKRLRSGRKYERIYVITHESVIRLLLKILQDYQNGEEWEIEIPNLSKFEFELD